MVDLLLNLIFIFQIVLFTYVILTFFPLEPGGFFSQLRSFLAGIFEPIANFIRGLLPPAIGRYSMLILFLLIIILQLFLESLR